MEVCLYEIYKTANDKFRIYLNFSNKDVVNAFHQINRNNAGVKKFIRIVECIGTGNSNRDIFNREGECTCMGKQVKIHALKVDSHRFYGYLFTNNKKHKSFCMLSYYKKQSQENTKAIESAINKISQMEINIIQES